MRDLIGSGQPGVIYTLHLDVPLAHARHYTGWARVLEDRLGYHASGRGSKLLAACVAAGIGWTLAAVEIGDRNRERQLKNQGGASRRCPICIQQGG